MLERSWSKWRNLKATMYEETKAGGPAGRAVPQWVWEMARSVVKSMLWGRGDY